MSVKSSWASWAAINLPKFSPHGFEVGLRDDNFCLAFRHYLLVIKLFVIWALTAQAATCRALCGVILVVMRKSFAEWSMMEISEDIEVEEVHR